MINYPNGKKVNQSKQNTSKANRGMKLENDLNNTNKYYLDNNIACIHKKPTPIQIVNVDYPKRSSAKITEAYFKLSSTTDYNGVYKTKAIDFEAKECKLKSFPFSSIHKHQIEHLKTVINHGAIAFLIIRFTSFDETYFIKAKKIIDLYELKEKKSIPYNWFKANAILIPYNYIIPIDYIKVIDMIIGG